MLEKGLKATGVDISLLLLQSRKAENGRGPRFVVADIAVLPIRDQSVSCVTLHDVIEHIPDVDELLEEITRVLKKDGRVVICSPNLLCPVKPLRHILGVEGSNVNFYGSTAKAINAIFINLALSLQKSFSSAAHFHYRQPILDGFQCPDDDATFLCNYADLKNWFESRGFSARYYQYLPGRSLVGRLKSGILKLFPWLDKGFCLIAERKKK